MMMVIYAYLFHSDRKINPNNRYIQISVLFYAFCQLINSAYLCSRNQISGI